MPGKPEVLVAAGGQLFPIHGQVPDDRPRAGDLLPRVYARHSGQVRKLKYPKQPIVSQLPDKPFHNVGALKSAARSF